jgi:hypothetical protein
LIDINSDRKKKQLKSIKSVFDLLEHLFVVVKIMTKMFKFVLLNFYIFIFRERIVHLLAVRPFKKPELLSRIVRGSFWNFFVFKFPLKRLCFHFIILKFVQTFIFLICFCSTILYLSSARLPKLQWAKYKNWKNEKNKSSSLKWRNTSQELV